jgi:cell wall-associated NlpC family hydrolase
MRHPVTNPARRIGQAVLALLFLLCAGWGVSVWRHLAPNAPIHLSPAVDASIKAGDLIFRIGNEWQGDAVRGISSLWAAREKRGDPYSHVGMLVGAPGHWQVLHSVPSEAQGRANAVVVDELDFFLASERARGIAIYRVEADEEARAAAVLHARSRLGTPFRLVANDTEGQYCTTLIWYAWQYAGIDLGARFEHLNVPLAEGDYLLPHSLRMAKRLRLLHISGDTPDDAP